jgi:hypothetical protein
VNLGLILYLKETLLKLRQCIFRILFGFFRQHLQGQIVDAFAINDALVFELGSISDFLKVHSLILGRLLQQSRTFSTLL